MTHAGNVFTAKQLLQQVWNYPPETAEPDLVRWHVKNLRAKIEFNLDHPVYIRTIARQGFMLDRRGSYLPERS
jgi:two-component system alkaline phosphatase synthesis response regulator PhoP/two-component system response regulator RpaA